jgi:hypothetical protein
MDSDAEGGLRARLHRPRPERTSDVLREIAAGEGARVGFRDVLADLRHRAFGFTLLIFALPCCLPMPPGIPTICGIAVLIIALNMIAVRQRLWLPSAIADKSIARADLARMVERVVPYLQRLERYCKPRLAIVTEAPGKVLIGILLFVLGFIMILPIPLIGNIPPGIAASVLAIGMTERDGLVVLVGAALSTIAIAVVLAATWATIVGLLGMLAA